MVFISLWKPDEKAVNNCLSQSKSGSFNYEKKYIGVTKNGAEALDETSLNADGYVRDLTRVKIGTGKATFERCCDVISKFGQFQLGWAEVNPKTSLRVGGKVCVCGKSLFLWTLNPLEILYVQNTKSDPGRRKDEIGIPPSFSGASQELRHIGVISMASSNMKLSPLSNEVSKRIQQFTYGHGTLKGHMLAGEERFSVWREEDDSVWFEILAVSKPANALSTVTYPLARFLQRRFAVESSKKVIEFVTDNVGFIKE